MSILEVKGLKKYYGNGENLVKALDGVDFLVEQGEFVAILGTSGSGKSTLLNMVGGLDIPTEGDVIVGGRNINHMSAEELTVFRRKQIGFVFQNYNLIPNLSVYENIVLPVQLDNRMPDRNYVEEVVKMLGLEEKMEVYPLKLSGGQQQRVSIARAMVSKPSIILADEPTGNLDSKTARSVIDLLKCTAEQWNQTILMITHNDELAEYCSRSIRMEDGKMSGKGISC